MRFTSPLFCGVIFVFLMTFDSEIFFAVLRYHMLLGGPNTSYLEQALPTQRVRVLNPVQWNSFWVDSQIIFPEFGVCHFETFHSVWNVLTFFPDCVVWVFSINVNVFCCGAKHFHVFSVFFFFNMCDCIKGGHYSFEKCIFLSLWCFFCCSK